MIFRRARLPQFSRNPETGCVTKSTNICDLNHTKICRPRGSSGFRALPNPSARLEFVSEPARR
jgi:hypothetical protein